MVPQLARLVVEHAHVDRWVFKVDGEFEGRGVGYFDLGSSKRLVGLVRGQRSAEPDAAYAEVQRLLAAVLPRKFVCAKPGLYRDYFAFAEEFCRQGGVIEASPSCVSKDVHSPGVLFAIEPDGQVEIQTTFEKLLSSPFAPCGFKFPLRCLPALNVRPAHAGPRAGRAARSGAGTTMRTCAGRARRRPGAGPADTIGRPS